MKEQPKWLIHTTEGASGPFELQHLRKLFAEGTINSKTLLRREDSTSWQLASQIPAISEVSGHSLKPRDVVRQESLHSSMTFPPSMPPQLGSLDGVTASFWSRSTLVYLSVSGMVVIGVSITLVVLLNATKSAPGDQQTSKQISSQSSYAIADDSINTGPSNDVDSLGQFADRKPSEKGRQNVSRESPLFDQDSPKKDDHPGGNDSIADVSKQFLGNLDTKTRSEFSSTEELVASTEQSVAIVSADGSLGSGFMVTENLLATNYHVIADADLGRLSLYFPSATDSEAGPYRASLCFEDPARDLAILRTNSMRPVAMLDSQYSFRRGQDVVVIGSPGLSNGKVLPNAVSRGVLSSVFREKNQFLFQLGIAINSGNSGGPVFSLNGKVIGVVTSKFTNKEAIAFCVPSSELDIVLRNAKSMDSDAIALSQNRHQLRSIIRKCFRQDIELFETFRYTHNSLLKDHGPSSLDGDARPILDSLWEYYQTKDPSFLQLDREHCNILIAKSRLNPSCQNEISKFLACHDQFVRSWQTCLLSLRAFGTKILEDFSELEKQLLELDGLFAIQPESCLKP